MKQKNTLYNLPVVIERDRDGRYIGTIPSLKSCYTYAKTLPVLYKRLHEVAQLCIYAHCYITKPRCTRT